MKPKTLMELRDLCLEKYVISVDSLPIHMAGTNGCWGRLIPQRLGEWRWAPGIKLYESIVSHEVSILEGDEGITPARLAQGVI